MITVYPYESLGFADHGWLKAHHHFSFAAYRNPARTGFGNLIVINDDIVEPGKGFSPHPHRDMEIITYVRQGSVTHRDDMGNSGIVNAGNVQVMSAGTGVTHSEYNLSEVPLRLFQIWIKPNQTSVKPRWDSAEFPKTTITNGKLDILVSGMEEHKKENALFIHQDAAIYGGSLANNTQIMHSIKHQAYVLVSKGSIEINGAKLNQGDGAEVTEEKNIKIQALSDSEMLIIDVGE